MRFSGGYRTLVLLVLFALSSGLGAAHGSPSAGNVPSPGNAGAQQLSSSARAALEGYLDAAQLPELQYPDFRNYRTDAQQFYRSVYGSASDSLPWVVGRRPSAQARAIIRLLQHADDEGLNPIDYDGPRWDGRVAALGSGRAADSELVQFDLALTISTMRYVSDLHRGRVNPRTFHFDLDIENKKIVLSEFLRQKLVNAEQVDAVMRTVEPPFPGYRRTIDSLKAYMKLAVEDDGEPLLVPPKHVKPGDSYSGINRLQGLLRLLGDLPENDANATPAAAYKGSLVTAVKHFQLRHGLEPNGIIDAHTFQELNTPLSQRVEQIKVTLERWRWLPHEFDRPPIVVNIPEFRLYAANEEYGTAFSMKVVVGRSYQHRTPVFAAELKSVIFRPYWNVPLDIQRKELLREVRKDPGYLTKHSYEIVDAKGNVVSDGSVSEEMRKPLYSGKLAIRQKPGTENSLGLVKFDLPNKYDVYMHGTPATQLFSRSRRDFSHGCIRVEDPVELAAWVLRDKPEWNRDRILAAMNGDSTLRVSLAESIPVLILYGTAIVTDSGEVHFFDDIYGYDVPLEHVLDQGYPYIAQE